MECCVLLKSHWYQVLRVDEKCIVGEQIIQKKSERRDESECSKVDRLIFVCL